MGTPAKQSKAKQSKASARSSFSGSRQSPPSPSNPRQPPTNKTFPPTKQLLSTNTKHTCSAIKRAGQRGKQKQSIEGEEGSKEAAEQGRKKDKKRSTHSPRPWRTRFASLSGSSGVCVCDKICLAEEAGRHIHIRTRTHGVSLPPPFLSMLFLGLQTGPPVHIRQIFEAVDEDSSGYLDYKELENVLRQMGLDNDEERQARVRHCKDFFAAAAAVVLLPLLCLPLPLPIASSVALYIPRGVVVLTRPAPASWQHPCVPLPAPFFCLLLSFSLLSTLVSSQSSSRTWTQTAMAR